MAYPMTPATEDLMRGHGLLNRLLIVYECAIDQLDGPDHAKAKLTSTKPPTSSGYSSKTITINSKRRTSFRSLFVTNYIR